MVAHKENGCRLCPKIFCCSECRDIHESRKHPKSKCSLCVNEDLPYKSLLSPEHHKISEFFSHVAFNHLPLGCKLCGDKYNSVEDLLTAPSCRWWSVELKRKKLEAEAPVTIPEDVPCITVCDSADPEKKLPLTPVFVSSIDDSKSLKITDSSSILRLKQENFDSPPELVRNTSTPMHGVGSLGQKQHGAAAIPQFVLKTPSSFDKHTFETTGSSGCSHVGSSAFESRYDTGMGSNVREPLVQLNLSNNNSNDNTSENQPEVEPSWDSPSCPVSKNQLPPINAEAAKDKKDQAERSIMKVEALDRVNRTSNSSRDSIGKRVRFSDQCLDLLGNVPSSTNCSIQETPADSSAYLADSEIFFEAQESLDDSGPCDGSVPYPCCQQSDVEQSDEGNSPTSSTPNRSDEEDDYRNNNNNNNNSSSTDIMDNNANGSNDTKNSSDKTDETSCTEDIKVNDDNSNIRKEKDISGTADEEKKIEKIADCSVEESPPTTSSRVLMMVLVEKTDSKSLSSLDLRPLIDSGLKKLEKRVTAVNNSPLADKGCYECSCRSSKFSTEVSSFSRKVNNALVEDKGAKVRVGSLRATKKEERQVGALSPRQESHDVVEKEPERQVSVKKSEGHVGSYMSDGLFSVVARVVRCALNKLPAVTSRNLSREPLPQSACSPVRITATSSLSITSTEVLAVGSDSSASHILLQRSASKRPRDRLDYGEEIRHLPPRDSSGILGPRVDAVSSPAAKRHRGWYRIRAREPIARMRKRQIVSPRGASLETQRFQQGSLTVGDTHLPLPSRAHQATQTE